MQNLILSSVLALSMFGAQRFAVDAFSSSPYAQAYAFSTDDMFGGGGAYLGVDTRDITADRLAPLQLKEERGVEVTMVDQDAPAGKAGIKEHDVILSINGAQVESVEQLRRMIREIPPGRVVNIGVSRNGQAMTLKAQLADRKTKFAFATPNIKMKDFKWEVKAMPELDLPMSVVVVHSSGRSGLMVENLTPQLGDFFGAKNGQGILVRSVEKGSLAEKAGFRAGDVVVRVNNETVSDTGDFTRTLRARKDNTVAVTIIREKKEQTLTLTLPDRKSSGSLEETLVPEIDADTQVELEGLKDELDNVQPQMELYTAELRRIKPEIEQATREAIQQQLEHLQKQLDSLKEQKEDIEEELQDQREEMKDQSEEQQDMLQERRPMQFPGQADI